MKPSGVKIIGKHPLPVWILIGGKLWSSSKETYLAWLSPPVAELLPRLEDGPLQQYKRYSCSRYKYTRYEVT